MMMMMMARWMSQGGPSHTPPPPPPQHQPLASRSGPPRRAPSGHRWLTDHAGKWVLVRESLGGQLVADGTGPHFAQSATSTGPRADSVANPHQSGSQNVVRTTDSDEKKKLLTDPWPTSFQWDQIEGGTSAMSKQETASEHDEDEKEIDCDSCNGLGRVEDQDGMIIQCANCSGTGRVAEEDDDLLSPEDWAAEFEEMNDEERLDAIRRVMAILGYDPNLADGLLDNFPASSEPSESTEV
jgi:hypothetical protein